MAAPIDISAPQLCRLIGTPDCPIVVDVRIDEDVQADPRLLPGAFRQPHHRIEDLAPRLQGRRVVVICHRGAKLSQGAAALLRLWGVAAVALDGGHLGWNDAGLPLVPLAALPPRDAEGRTLWVTRRRPKVDRIACPWLIRRFVDRRARFLFVAPDEVHAVAERFGATPFDAMPVSTEGGDWGHRGEFCTFDAMVERFGLDTPPLRRLATIVRGADTRRPDLAAESSGLLALSLGLSELFTEDLAQLDAAMVVYDALYHWARETAQAGSDKRAVA
ncbi:chromate resistance protein ChrB domain-containing protein [Thalassobaculum salexigens]|uniref:chromate resistance protein ChrB domain-containing protein n=1 Tax=Thalassobaculum salexigens TaxID=455360 RepID=UPI00248F2E30|nr:chromate resistance protein ChrB domain-containing protein [Thalassobaculum salexigens]